MKTALDTPCLAMTPFARFLFNKTSFIFCGLLVSLASCTTPQSTHHYSAVPMVQPLTTTEVVTQSFNAAQPDFSNASYQPMPMEQPVTPAIYNPDDTIDEAVLVKSGSPAIRASSYLLIDAHTGRALAARNADTPRAVASTQKLVTALVVLDAGNLDKRVQVTASDVKVEPTCLGIRPGEYYTRRELLYAFLIKSCNDVANVLARDNAGSIPAFAARMNAKARSLGCTSSNFKNPHGLTVPGQFSTARDMSRIAMAAYRNSFIRDAVRRKHYTFRRYSGRMVALKNTNDLLGVMAECNGMKTGYTVAAGRCLVSTASNRGRDVILVQLGTKTKFIWDDGYVLMSWGLQRASSGRSVAMRN